MSKYDEAINELCNYLHPEYSTESKIFISDTTAKTALSALREAAEREKGCECCDTKRHTKTGEKEWVTTVKFYEIGDGGYHHVKPVFCPMCGRPLTKDGA